ncbi:MAG: trypsin-like peptidase domain-containing protein, partial [Pseudonocardia sp.]
GQAPAGSGLDVVPAVAARVDPSVVTILTGSGNGSGVVLVDLIQTDAAISPGNSGGVMVDAAGEVVGLSLAYIPPQAGAVSRPGISR